MTNDSKIEDVPNIVLDIYRETGQNTRQKKPKRHSSYASTDIVRPQDQFINITAEDILNENKKKRRNHLGKLQITNQ